MTTPMFGRCTTSNAAVLQFVQATIDRCQPSQVHWCDGSDEERKHLLKRAVDEKVLTPLHPEKWPGCYYHRSQVNDVARVEQCTYICTPTEEEAGPTNNWGDPKKLLPKLHQMLEGAMRGRTLYVVPYLMGLPGSKFSRVGVEVTDSIYVALSMGIMTRMGQVALDHLGGSDDFNRGTHSMLDIDPTRRIIAHFPQDNAIVSVGSNYGGNVLLGKKCLALRIGSYLGRREGWMAEHMLVMGVESPEGEKTFVAAAFPSACGKTNFAMLQPPEHFAGWKIWTVGDDIAWMRPGADGRLYAINPEAGYFGVVPGTNQQSNPRAMEIIRHDTIFTNVGITDDGDIWWEGKDSDPPKQAWDWKGDPWTPESKGPLAHPNSRFTAPIANNPSLAPEASDPQGVPISAIIFGGRRAQTLPLIFQSFNWIHGVYVGATMGSETTSAAAGQTGQLRLDPMAMLPFCGYNISDYFRHWILMRHRIKYPPRIFHVNWFRKSEAGKYLWPGYGDNMRILKWIVDRCHGRANACESPLGWMPEAHHVDLTNMPEFTSSDFAQVQAIDLQAWKRELISQDELFIKLHSHLPKEMIFQRELLISRL